MKKPSLFKRMKIEASSFLVEELQKRNFNRFTEKELTEVRGYYPHVDKSFLDELLNYRFNKCLPIKLNFDNFIVDVKILRTSENKIDNTGGNPVVVGKIVINEVLTKVSFVSKKVENNTFHILGPTEETSSEKKVKTRHKLLELPDMRALILVELSKITNVHNELCRIFKDKEGIHPSILEEPGYCLTESEVKEINNE